MRAWWLAAVVIALLLVGTELRTSRAPSESVAAATDAAIVLDTAVATPGNRVELRAGRDGHFRTTALVNGAPVDFLVDSGATTVLLRPEDARRAGLHPSGLRMSQRVLTANGPIGAAPVELRELRLGPLALRRVAALVPEVDPGISLLGMNVLRELRGFEMADDRLVLWW
jgi:aspartyl protease family protein